jgi:hypothetical protein
MKSKGKSESERQAEYIARQHAKGLVKTCVWVPEGDQDTIQDLAEGLRNNHTPQQHDENQIELEIT